MSRTDRLALILSLAAICAAHFVSEKVFERLPHLEDEMAYVWQAKVYACGELTVPSPGHPKSMLVPFVVDYNGQRFSKYPPGWSVLLALGVMFAAGEWVNPLLAGLGIWLIYKLGQKVFNPGIGLLAAFLTLTSPFFLLNSGSLLSHPWSLVLSLSFSLAWLDTFYGIDQKKQHEKPKKGLPLLIHSMFRSPPKWLTILVAGFSLGVLALTRPLTAMGVGFPFAIHGIILLVRRDHTARRHVILIGVISISIGALVLAWQYAVTGNPIQNPYALWWTYDKVGFGPGVGRMTGGHSLYWAWFDMKRSLNVAWSDLFGWGKFSWIFLPFGLWAGRRNGHAWLIGSVFVSLVMVYMTYWIGSSLFGPRYYYEGLSSLAVISASGVFWLADGIVRQKNWRKIYRIATFLLVCFLVGYNLIVYLPGRLLGMVGLYGIRRAQMEPFLTWEAQALAPAVVVVHISDTWTEYGGLLELEDPWLTTPFIFALNQGEYTNTALQNDYPDRRLIHYYPDEPYKFYDSPR